MVCRRDVVIRLAGVGGALALSRVLPALAALAAPTSRARPAQPMSARERIDRVLTGRDVDRSPFSAWRSLGDQGQPGTRHAELTLAYWRCVRPDLLKVMNEFAYPRPVRGLLALREEVSPFPEQVRALELIHEGLRGETYFVDTLPNPWHVAEALSSRAEVLRLKEEQPQQLLDALELIARSEANHARLALGAGASGIFLGVSNAQDGVLSAAEHARFSEPFDRIVLDAARAAPLNTLHLHTDAALGDRLHPEVLDRPWPAAVLSYSVHGTGLATEVVRPRWDGVIMAGVDERRYRRLSQADLRAQWAAARRGAGARFILAGGCTLPADATDAEVRALLDLVENGRD